MTDPITAEDRRRVHAYLDNANASEQRTAESSKNSFFKWLGQKGLDYLIKKLFDFTWEAIKSAIGI